MFDELRSVQSIFNLVAKVLDVLCPQWKHKIIRSSTDGAPNMTGCHSGFTTRLANGALGQVFYRVWCLAHQLNIIIKDSLKAIADKAGLSVYDHSDDDLWASPPAGYIDSTNRQQVPVLHQCQVDVCLKDFLLNS